MLQSGKTPLPSNEAIKELEKEVQGIERKLPSEYNKKCVWFEVAKDDSLEEVLYVHTANMNKAVECFIQHNSLIDLLRQKGLF